VPTPSTGWSRRRARRALRRALPRFDVRLRSLRPGIAFTARIKAIVVSEPPYPHSIEELAGTIRSTLRDAANDISGKCDPTDLATASDRCRIHLARTRSMAGDPPVEFRADLVTLTLRHDDAAAVGTLLDAQRRQGVADVLRRQRTDALADELASPAAVLARWLERDNSDWSQLPQAEHLQGIADAFVQHRPEHTQTPEHQLLEILREFLATFPELHEKRMLYALLAAGMHRAGRPEHATKTQALLNGHDPRPEVTGTLEDPEALK
jgi:hypothetical protein